MAERRITPGGVLCSMVVTLAVLAGVGPVRASTGPLPWEITADSLVRLDEPNSILAEGNVVMIRPKNLG
ncbi:MAG: hypothetical protein KKE82_08270, partial [Proteobacteria bacterium]|nr:hypothetical protein [Pseudomonadota bacterium]MBU1546743.1 hypothetical protein [Pseudomonadota bacterium]